MHLTIQSLWPITVPLLIAELALVIFCLVDIWHADRQVRGGNKILWSVIVVIVGTLGPLVYLFWGREDL